MRQYLLSHGIDASRVQIETVGEDEASPAPNDWAKDRRVEVQLGR